MNMKPVESCAFRFPCFIHCHIPTNKQYKIYILAFDANFFVIQNIGYNMSIVHILLATTVNISHSPSQWAATTDLPVLSAFVLC